MYQMIFHFIIQSSSLKNSLNMQFDFQLQDGRIKKGSVPISSHKSIYDKMENKKERPKCSLD